MKFECQNEAQRILHAMRRDALEQNERLGKIFRLDIPNAKTEF